MNPNYEAWEKAFVAHHGHLPTREDAFAYGREFARGDTVQVRPAPKPEPQPSMQMVGYVVNVGPGSG